MRMRPAIATLLLLALPPLASAQESEPVLPDAPFEPAAVPS